MPEFLEQKLKAQYPNNPNAVYGTMNKLGAMQGNKITEKGREMEKNHMEKEAGNNLREMRIEIMRGKGKEGKPGPITGHIVHHEHMHVPSKSGAFVTQDETEKYPFGPNGEPHEEGGDGLTDHVARHLGFGGGDAMENPKPKESGMEAASEEEG